MVIVLSVLRFTASDYTFGILWSLVILYCLSLDLRLLITPLVSCGHCIVFRFTAVLRFTASEYTFGILWSLYCLSLDLRLLITPLVSCGHCIVWIRLLITPLVSCGHVLSVLRFTASDYTFGILWSLYCLSLDLRLLITPLVSCGHCIVCPSMYGF